MASTITISTQPTSQTVNLKSHIEDVAHSATFSALAAAVSSVGGGDVPVTYQWQRSINGGTTFSNIGGATSSSYTVVDAPVTATGYGYRVRVSAQDASTVSSASAVLTVENQYAQFATDTEPGSARFGRLYASEIL